MWNTKIFYTPTARDRWVARNMSRYQITEVLINNAYSVEYRKLVAIRMPR